ncbi:MAG: DUF1571 domain-containing protein [Planctomycetaceae bacterium]
MNHQSHTISLTRREVLSGLFGGALLAVPATSLLAEERLAAATRLEQGHILAPALKMARDADNVLETITDYTGTFHKDVIVSKQRVRHQLEIKVREKPFSVYLKFVKPDAGREVIYVDGKNNGQLLTHGVGLEAIVGTLELDPTGSIAMQGSRYPVTVFGMRKMLRKVITQWQAELTTTDAVVKFYPNAKIGSLECRVVQSSHARRQSNVKFHMTRMYVAKQTGLPVRVEQFAFPVRTGAKPVMLEQYSYLNIRKSVGLKAIDFDTRNPAYDY